MSKKDIKSERQKERQKDNQKRQTDRQSLGREAPLLKSMLHNSKNVIH